MAASKLSDLLPIDPSLAKPNAYQVFGLEDGRDESAVGESIRRVYAHLKQSKATADPNAWKQAAQLAESARKILEDPARRQALDQSLASRVRAADASASDDPVAAGPKVSVTDEDPLAGLLPPVDPLATAKGLPSASTPPASTPQNKQASAVLGTPPGLSSAASVLGTPPASQTAVPAQTATQPVATSATASGNESAIGVDVASKAWSPAKPSKKKRRKKSNGVYLFGFFVLLMLGAIIGLLQFLSGGNRIAINPPQPGGKVVAPPMPRDGGDRNDPRRPSDGVLADAPASGVAGSLRGDDQGVTGSGIGQNNPLANPPGMNGAGTSENAAMPSEAGMGPDSKPNPPGVPDPMMTDEPDASESATPEPSTTEPMKPEPTPDTPTPDQPSPEVLAANQAKIEAVEKLIQTAQWEQMKPAADGLLKLELSGEQFDRASSLYDIADLANYYRGAIGRGLTSLTTGNTFEYVEDVPVIVVEVSSDRLSIQYNRKTQTYTIDELPPRLTERLVSLTLSSEKPDTIAAQALYRLIHPATNTEYREDAFETLATLDGRLEKVDTEMLQKVAKEILSK